MAIVVDTKSEMKKSLSNDTKDKKGLNDSSIIEEEKEEINKNESHPANNDIKTIIKDENEAPSWDMVVSSISSGDILKRGLVEEEIDLRKAIFSPEALQISNSLDTRPTPQKTKELLEQWLKMWTTEIPPTQNEKSSPLFISRYVQKKFDEILHLTRFHQHPNPLLTALCCDLFSILINSLSTLYPILPSLLHEIYHGIYKNYQIPKDSSSSSPTDTKMIPYFDLLSSLTNQQNLLNNQIHRWTIHQQQLQHFNEHRTAVLARAERKWRINLLSFAFKLWKDHAISLKLQREKLLHFISLYPKQYFKTSIIFHKWRMMAIAHSIEKVKRDIILQEEQYENLKAKNIDSISQINQSLTKRDNILENVVEIKQTHSQKIREINVLHEIHQTFSQDNLYSIINYTLQTAISSINFLLSDIDFIKNEVIYSPLSLLPDLSTSEAIIQLTTMDEIELIKLWVNYQLKIAPTPFTYSLSNFGSDLQDSNIFYTLIATISDGIISTTELLELINNDDNYDLRMNTLNEYIIKLSDNYIHYFHPNDVVEGLYPDMNCALLCLFFCDFPHLPYDMSPFSPKVITHIYSQIKKIHNIQNDVDNQNFDSRDIISTCQESFNLFKTLQIEIQKAWANQRLYFHLKHRLSNFILEILMKQYKGYPINIFDGNSGHKLNLFGEVEFDDLWDILGSFNEDKDSIIVKIKEAINNENETLRLIFNKYSIRLKDNNIFSLNYLSYLRFLHDYHIYSYNFTLYDSHIIFETCFNHSLQKENQNSPDNDESLESKVDIGLYSFENASLYPSTFMECLIRIAFHRYQQSELHIRLRVLFSLFHNNNFHYVKTQQSDSENINNTSLFEDFEDDFSKTLSLPPTLKVIEIYQTQLLQIFYKYAHHDKTENPLYYYITIDDLFKLCNDIKIITDDQISMNDLQTIFFHLLSAPTEMQNKIDNDETEQNVEIKYDEGLVFPLFCESLAAIASFLNPDPFGEISTKLKNFLETKVFNYINIKLEQ